MDAKLRWVALVVLSIAVAFSWTAAWGQGYPARPVIFVSPFPPGGGNDLIARTVATPLQKYLGQNVIVENRPGAETVVSMSGVARAAPDGYTLMLTLHDGMVIGKAAGFQLGFDPVADLTAIAQIGTDEFLVLNGRKGPGRVQLISVRPR